MIVNYSYEIINVDKEAKTMEIVYTSEKYGTLHVGCRMPWKDETVEDIVLMYNPSAYWLELDREVMDVEVGVKGNQEDSHPHPDDPEEPFTAEEIEELRLKEYRFTSDPVFFKWQRGEATEQEWLDAVEKVKKSYPYESDK
jgi:hypothetical protein